MITVNLTLLATIYALAGAICLFWPRQLQAFGNMPALSSM